MQDTLQKGTEQTKDSDSTSPLKAETAKYGAFNRALDAQQASVDRSVEVEKAKCSVADRVVAESCRTLSFPVIEANEKRMSGIITEFKTKSDAMHKAVVAEGSKPSGGDPQKMKELMTNETNFQAIYYQSDALGFPEMLRLLRGTDKERADALEKLKAGQPKEENK